MGLDRTEYGFRDERYERFPPVVQVAVVSGECPSNCVYCPVGLRNKGELSDELAAELQKAYFPLALFKRVALEVARYSWAILRLHGRGEPLAHPEYFRMVQFAKDAGVRTITGFTNGIYLFEHIVDLLEARIDLIEVSADAGDNEHYVRWRRNSNFERVRAGVERLFVERNSRPGCTTRIVVSAVDHPEFQSHYPVFAETWGPLCDKLLVRPFHTYSGRIADPYTDQRSKTNYVPCVQLWQRFSISPTGLVNVCFNDWGDHETMGDLRDAGATIAAIWRNHAFETARAKSLDGPFLRCCKACSGSSLSSWGADGYQHWVHRLLSGPLRT